MIGAPNGGSGATLFTGVDTAVFATAFARRLRSAGVEVSFAAIERCVRSLAVVGPLDLDTLYWTCRVCFTSRPADLAAFDRVFAQVFHDLAGLDRAGRRGQGAPVSTGDELHRVRRGAMGVDRSTAGLPWATLPSASVDEDDTVGPDDELVIPELRPSADAVLLERRFEDLDEEELARIGVELEALMPAWPDRPTRRRRASHSTGVTSLRRSVRSALRTGGEVVTLVQERPSRRPRPLVVLVDVSGSMETYARAYLHLTRALAVAHRAEVFAFATELTRITTSLRLHSPAEAIDAASASVGDRFGGTRIATSIGRLTRDARWSTVTRGSVVLVCSDGWDADPAGALDREMARLRRMAHRVVWVNPRSATEGYEPLTAGMAAALPHCDHFLSGHTLAAMRDVIDAVAHR